MTSDTPHSQNRRRALALIGAAALPALSHGPLQAQTRFPDRPITLIVPFAPGGIADITARAVAEVMSQRLGQPIVVDNRPSAGSIVASQAVATARPDGHTLLLMSNGNAVSVGLFKKLPYDTRKDFVGISTLGYFDIGLFVPAGSRFNSLKDTVAYARANPGKLNIGSISAGSTQHLAAKMFETVAGLEAVIVPYKGSPAVVTALRTGEIDLAFEILGPMLPQVQAGVVKALAVSSDKRNPALPEVPTAIEAGVPGYNVASWNALAAPAGTPPAVIDVLNRAAREAVESPAVRDKLAKLGMRVSSSTPSELERLLASEIDRWGGVIRAAKIQPE
jgi:tripartite-type tricarboxylate transporter receptor subunit TctC